MFLVCHRKRINHLNDLAENRCAIGSSVQIGEIAYDIEACVHVHTSRKPGAAPLGAAPAFTYRPLPAEWLIRSSYFLSDARSAASAFWIFSIVALMTLI